MFLCLKTLKIKKIKDALFLSAGGAVKIVGVLIKKMSRYIEIDRLMMAKQMII